jgi:hypothetical protein
MEIFYKPPKTRYSKTVSVSKSADGWLLPCAEKSREGKMMRKEITVKISVT